MLLQVAVPFVKDPLMVVGVGVKGNPKRTQAFSGYPSFQTTSGLWRPDGSAGDSFERPLASRRPLGLAEPRPNERS